MTTSKKTIPWLDALRFIAAFMVLLSHTRTDFFTEWNLLPAEQQSVFTMIFYFIGRLGHEAVIVFFILSGYLVGGKLIDRVQDKSFDVRTYSVDRIVRIGIPLATAILYYFLVSLFVESETFNIVTALGNLFSLQGICCEPLVPPFWSLSWEVWFYITGATIAYILTTKNELGGGKKIAFLVFGVFAILYSVRGAHYLMLWVMGAICYKIKTVKVRPVLILFILVSIAVLCVLSMSQSGTNTTFVNIHIDRSLITTILGFCFCILIQQLILIEPKGIWIKVNTVFSKLAAFSYTLYLTHMITEYWVFEYFVDRNKGLITISDISIWALFVLVCLFVSWLLYYFTERHTAAVKRYIKAKLLH